MIKSKFSRRIALEISKQTTNIVFTCASTLIQAIFRGHLARCSYVRRKSHFVRHFVRHPVRPEHAITVPKHYYDSRIDWNCVDTFFAATETQIEHQRMQHQIKRRKIMQSYVPKIAQLGYISKICAIEQTKNIRQFDKFATNDAKQRINDVLNNWYKGDLWTIFGKVFNIRQRKTHIYASPFYCKSGIVKRYLSDGQQFHPAETFSMLRKHGWSNELSRYAHRVVELRCEFYDHKTMRHGHPTNASNVGIQIFYTVGTQLHQQYVVTPSSLLLLSHAQINMLSMVSKSFTQSLGDVFVLILEYSISTFCLARNFPCKYQLYSFWGRNDPSTY